MRKILLSVHSMNLEIILMRMKLQMQMRTGGIFRGTQSYKYSALKQFAVYKKFKVVYSIIFIG